MNITENEFNEIFFKNLFKEFIMDTQGHHFAVDQLDEMATIFSRVFLREFDAGKTSTQLIQEHGDIEKWLNEQIKNYKS